MTIKKPDLSRAFYIYDQIRRVGYGGLKSQVGWAPSRAVTVYWPQRCVYVVEGACYYNGSLYIPQKHFSGQTFDNDVLLHEFGHFVMSEVYGNNNYVVYACPGFAHFLNAHETKRCAWSEGWATFLQAMLQGAPDYVDNVSRIEVDLEFPTPGLHLPPPADPPVSNADNETAVAAILWDIYDGIDAATEPADRLSDGVNGPDGNGIWYLLSHARPGNFPPLDFSDNPPNIETFWDEWIAHHESASGRIACIFYNYLAFLSEKTPLPHGFCPDTLEASYYNDSPAPYQIGGPITWPTFTSFVLTRPESCVAFETNTTPPAPGVNGTFWSARWQGLLLVPSNGDYIFHFDRLDDGARLYMDGNETPVLESWLVQGPHSYSSLPLYLKAGLHTLKLEYAQGPAWQAGLYLGWESLPLFGKEIINPVMSVGICSYPPGMQSQTIEIPQSVETPTWQPTGTPTSP